MVFHTGMALSQGYQNYSLHPKLVVWISRLPSLPDLNTVNALNTFMYTLDSAGILSVMDGLYFLGADPFVASYTNLISTKWDGTPSASVSSAYVAGQGITGDGSSVSISFVPNLATATGINYTQNNAHMAVWSTTSLSSSPVSSMFGANKFGISAALRINSKTSVTVQANGTTSVTATVTDSDSFTAWTRSDASNITIYKDGLVLSGSLASTGLTFGELSAFKVGTLNYDKNTLALISWGGALTTDQLQIYNVAALILLNSFGSTTPENTESGEIILPAYFTNTTMAAVSAVNIAGFRVIQQNIAPASNATTGSTYANFPLTDAATFRADASATSTNTSIYNSQFIWQSRAIVPANSTLNDRPNYTPTGIVPGVGAVSMVNAAGLRCWPRFSTINKAIGNSLVQALYGVGAPATNPGYETDPVRMGYADCAAYYGLSTPVSWVDAYNNRETQFPDVFVTRIGGASGTYATCMDVPILPPGRLVDIPNLKRGMALDAEAQDGRTSAQLLSNIQLMAAICAYYNFELLVYPNVFINSGAINTGFDINNLWQINQIPNVKLSLMAWQQYANTDVGAQIDASEALLRGPAGDKTINYANLLMGVGMGIGVQEMSATNAARIRSRITGRGYGGVLFWRNYGIAGGTLDRSYNQTMATVLGLPTS